MYIVGGLIKTMAGTDIRDGCIRIRDGKILEISERDGQDMPEEIAAQESCKKV